MRRTRADNFSSGLGGPVVPVDTRQATKTVPLPLQGITDGIIALCFRTSGSRISSLGIAIRAGDVDWLRRLTTKVVGDLADPRPTKRGRKAAVSEKNAGPTI